MVLQKIMKGEMITIIVIIIIIHELFISIQKKKACVWSFYVFYKANEWEHFTCIVFNLSVWEVSGSVAFWVCLSQTKKLKRRSHN